MLVLRVSENQDGDPLTMKELSYYTLENTNGEKFKDTIEYRNQHTDEICYIAEIPRSGWKLVSKEIINNSKGRDYIEQTKLLRDSLVEVDALTPEEQEECSDDKLEKLKEIMKKNSAVAAKQLSNLKINQNHRRTMVEALYDWMLYYKNTDKEKLLQNGGDWTSSLGSYGKLFCLVGNSIKNSSDFFPTYMGSNHAKDSYLHVNGVVSTR